MNQRGGGGCRGILSKFYWASSYAFYIKQMVTCEHPLELLEIGKN